MNPGTLAGSFGLFCTAKYATGDSGFLLDLTVVLSYVLRFLSPPLIYLMKAW